MEIYDTPIDAELEFEDYEDMDGQECESDLKGKTQSLKVSAATSPSSTNHYSETPGLPLPPTPQQTYDCPRPQLKQPYDLIAPHQRYDRLPSLHYESPVPTLSKVPSMSRLS